MIKSAAPASPPLESCRGEWTSGPLILRPLSRKPLDRRDAYRMVTRVAQAARLHRHISPLSLRHTAIAMAIDAGVPLRDAQILARSVMPIQGPLSTTTAHGATTDRHGIRFLTAYVAGV